MQSSRADTSADLKYMLSWSPGYVPPVTGIWTTLVRVYVQPTGTARTPQLQPQKSDPQTTQRCHQDRTRKTGIYVANQQDHTTVDRKAKL